LPENDLPADLRRPAVTRLYRGAVRAQREREREREREGGGEEFEGARTSLRDPAVLAGRSPEYARVNQVLSGRTWDGYDGAGARSEMIGVPARGGPIVTARNGSSIFP